MSRHASFVAAALAHNPPQPGGNPCRRPDFSGSDLRICVTDALRVGLDCIPDYRRKLLETVVRHQSPDSVPMPRTVRNRELEELAELKLLEQASQGSLANQWKLTRKAEELLEAAGLLIRLSQPSQSVRG
jgi:hypothetical protein